MSCGKIIESRYSTDPPAGSHIAYSPPSPTLDRLHSRVRHRHHYLSAVQRPLDAHCGDRRSRSDHQDFEPPGLAHPRSTTSPGPARRVPTNGLSSPRIPVQCRSRHTPPLPSSPTPTPQWNDRLTRSWKNGPCRTISAWNSRLSDGNVCELTPQRGL